MKSSMDLSGLEQIKGDERADLMNECHDKFGADLGKTLVQSSFFGVALTWSVSCLPLVRAPR